MSAYDKLEGQLRASVARNASRRPARWLRLQSWSKGASALIVALGTATALGVAVVVLVSLHHSRASSSKPATSGMTHHRSRLGPRPKDPGPIPPDVQDGAVAAAWNTAWARDPACRPGPGSAAGSGVSHATPSQAMLSSIPALDLPATRADRLPDRFHVSGRLRPLMFERGEVYVRYIRLVRVVDGLSFYLVPAAHLGRPPLSPAAANRCYQLTLAALRAELPSVPAAKRAATLRYGEAEFALGRYNLETSSVHEGVFLFTEGANRSGGADGGQSPATIRQTGMLGGGGGGTPPSPIVMDGIVPAGVATVTLQFPPSRRGSQHLPPLSATGHVVNNVFVIPVRTLFERGGWPTTAIWRSASGKVVKTVDERPFHP